MWSKDTLDLYNSLFLSYINQSIAEEGVNIELPNDTRFYIGLDITGSHYIGVKTNLPSVVTFELVGSYVGSLDDSSQPHTHVFFSYHIVSDKEEDNLFDENGYWFELQIGYSRLRVPLGNEIQVVPISAEDIYSIVGNETYISKELKSIPIFGKNLGTGIAFEDSSLS